MRLQIGTIVYRDKRTGILTQIKPLYAEATKELEEAQQTLFAEATSMFVNDLLKKEQL